MNTTVYILGILLQGIAGVIALLQVRYAPRKLPWLLIALSSLLIVARRAVTLEHVMKTGGEFTAGEILTLIVSLLFFLGVVLMTRMFSGVWKDNVALKTSENALRESEEKFSLVFRKAPVMAAITVLEDGTYLDVNDKFIEVSGFTRGELLGKTSVEVGWLRAEDRQWLIEALHSQGKFSGMECTSYAKDGRPIDCLYHCDLVNIGGVTRLLTMVLDITDRNRAEAERARLEAENLQLQKAKSLGRMAGAIAHLFNNQLSVVIGNLELALVDLSEDAAIRESLIDAMRAARRSAETSGLMLTYIGQSTDKGDLLDLSKVCRQNLPVLQNAMPEGVALKTELMPSGPVVRAQADQIKKVLTNLIANGWESIGHGTGAVTLATRIIPASEIPKSNLFPVDWKPAGVVFSCLEVTDTGCGMAEDNLDNIFDPFYTTKFTGRGLGLAVVLGIVKSWGGAIGVESRKNQGSTFRVFLPLVGDELPRPPEDATEVHHVDFGGAVLLVDSQDSVRNMAQSMLERLGYEVLAVSGGAEAVSLLRETPDRVRCVVTDLTMSGMDGLETLAALRKIRPLIPVVLTSGNDEAQVMMGRYSEQPQAFLHKPYSKDDLQAAIDMALKKLPGTR